MVDNQILERRRWEKQNTKWIIFSYCFLGFVPFLKIGIRVRQTKWIVAGGIYAAIFFGMILTASKDNPLSGANNEIANRVRTVLFLGYYIGSIVHCHLVKRKYLQLLAAKLKEENKFSFPNMTYPQQTYNSVSNQQISRTSTLCPKCGTISSGSFCPICGTSLVNIGNGYNTAVPDSKKCPKCGAVASGKFCSICGTSIASVNNQNTTNTMHPNICPQCGSLSNGKFCRYCGTSVLASNNPNMMATNNIIQNQQQGTYAATTINNPEGGIVDINKCNEGAFEALPGISAAMAKRLIDYRNANKGFSSVDEFINIAELKPHFAIQIRDKVTCSAKIQSQNIQSDRRLDL